MTKLEIILSKDLRFKIICRPSEAMDIVYTILREFHANEDILIHYKSKEGDGLKLDREAIAEVYFNKEIPFHGKLKSLKVFDKGLTEDEIIKLTE